MAGENGKSDALTRCDVSTDVEKWISHDDAAGIFSANFWNDEDVERAKQWWVLDGDTQSLMTHLDALGINEAFSAVTHTLRSEGKLGGEYWMLAPAPVVLRHYGANFPRSSMSMRWSCHGIGSLYLQRRPSRRSAGGRKN